MTEKLYKEKMKFWIKKRKCAICVKVFRSKWD